MHEPGKTVSGSDHPGAVHQDPSTHQTTIKLEVDQPGPAAWRSRRAAHDPGARLCDVLHRGQPLTTHCCSDTETPTVKKKCRNNLYCVQILNIGALSLFFLTSQTKTEG